MASAKAQCQFCLEGVKYCSVIRPAANWSSNRPEDTFLNILDQVLHRGYCHKHNNHNTTDYKFLNGSQLQEPTKRGIDIYNALFHRDCSYDEVVSKYAPAKEHRMVKECVVLPLCSVLAHGYDLNLEMCGIPIANHLEEQIIQAIFKEVDEQRALPYRFRGKIATMLPQWPLPLFIYAKLRGYYTRECEPELFCSQCAGNDYTSRLPSICPCRSCPEIPKEPRITAQQRQRMEANRRDAFARLAHKRKQKRPHQRMQVDQCSTNR